MTSGAENSNLLAEFEEAFKETMSTLTQEDTMFDRSPETLQHELENKVLRFTEIARQLETFFSQKRYVIYYLKSIFKAQIYKIAIFYFSNHDLFIDCLGFSYTLTSQK